MRKKALGLPYAQTTKEKFKHVPRSEDWVVALLRWYYSRFAEETETVV